MTFLIVIVIVCTSCDNVAESWSSYECYTLLSVKQHDPKNFHITSVKTLTVHRVLVMYCWFMCRSRQANSKKWTYLRRQETPLQSSSLSISTRMQRTLERQSIVHCTAGGNPTNSTIRGCGMMQVGVTAPMSHMTWVTICDCLNLTVALWPHW